MIVLLALAQLVVIVDGDTLRLDGERVRLIGVDAPEIHHAECPLERARGEAAKAALAALTQGHALVLRRNGHDRYRRTLAVVLADGVDLNAAMIASGHAVTWDGSKHDWCN